MSYIFVTHYNLCCVTLLVCRLHFVTAFDVGRVTVCVQSSLTLIIVRRALYKCYPLLLLLLTQLSFGDHYPYCLLNDAIFIESKGELAF